MCDPSKGKKLEVRNNIVYVSLHPTTALNKNKRMSVDLNRIDWCFLTVCPFCNRDLHHHDVHKRHWLLTGMLSSWKQAVLLDFHLPLLPGLTGTIGLDKKALKYTLVIIQIVSKILKIVIEESHQRLILLQVAAI